MQTKVLDLIENLGEFDLIALPISTFQKKNGCITITEGGILEKFTRKFVELPKKMGEVIEIFGGCPHDVISTVVNGRTVKIFSFPITPVTIIVNNPNNIVQTQFLNKFKKGKMIPGFLCKPRIDMLEYSSIKLAEIVKWYKLTDVAIPINAFGLEPSDTKDIQTMRSILDKYLGNNCYLIIPPRNSENNVLNSVASNISYENEEIDE